MMKTDTKNGWVYLLESNNFVKVGMTMGSLESRISNYRTHNPHEIKVVQSAFVSDPMRLELEVLNTIFPGGKKQGTDWVEKDVKLVDIIKEKITTYEKKNSIEKDKTGSRKQSFANLNIPFTMVANCVLNDKTLTARAKGIYAYLYSKPDGWDFNYIRIAKDHKESKNTILNAIHELEKAKYLERRKLPSGRSEYFLTFEPMTKDWSQASDQSTVRPKIGTVSNKDKESKKESSAEASSAPWLLEDKLKEMEQKENSHLDIIATFIREKPVKVDNSKQLTAIIKRYARVASQLSGAYTNKQIFGAAEKIRSENKRRESRGDTVDWTLETIFKTLTK